MGGGPDLSSHWGTCRDTVPLDVTRAVNFTFPLKFAQKTKTVLTLSVGGGLLVSIPILRRAPPNELAGYGGVGSVSFGGKVSLGLNVYIRIQTPRSVLYEKAPSNVMNSSIRSEQACPMKINAGGFREPSKLPVRQASGR